MYTDRIRHKLDPAPYHGGEDCTVIAYRYDDMPDIFVLSTTDGSNTIELDRQQIQRLLELSQP